jgi:hypothetical protein
VCGFESHPPHHLVNVRTPGSKIWARPREDREIYLRDHPAESFIEAVQGARRHSADTIIMTVKAFAGKPEVLYVALNYTCHRGMAVSMAPETTPSRTRGGATV